MKHKCQTCGKEFESVEQSDNPICPECDKTTRLYSGGQKSILETLKKDHGIESGVTLEAPDKSSDPGKTTRLSSGKPDEKYNIEDEITRGGMGAILRSLDRDIRRQVAMKVMLDKGSLSKDRIERFIEEAQVTGQLEHPNIVPIHELGIDSRGKVYFTMKMIHGQSLSEVIDAIARKDEQALEKYTWTELCNIFLKICDGVAFAHSRGVIHRDLKPDNIMVGEYGEVLVVDWGLAKIRGHADRKSEDVVKTLRSEEDLSKTLDGQVAGTPSYMPPEQAEGEIDKIDERSDIYSLGAVLYEMLSLLPPFRGTTTTEIIVKVCEGNLTAPETLAPSRDIPKELSAICMKAMSHNQTDRYRNVAELSADIRLFFEGRSVSAKEDTFSEAVIKLVKRNKEICGTAAAAVLIIAILSGIGVWRIVKEKNRATDNMDRFLKEHEARKKDRDLAAPALVDRALSEVEKQKLDSAMEYVDSAINFEKNLYRAYLLKGQLFVCKGDFIKAAESLEQCLELKEDAHTQKLLALCREAVKRSIQTEFNGQFSKIFMKQGMFALAEQMAGSVKELVAMYNQRLKPYGMNHVSVDANGKICFSVLNMKKKPHDLTPLKGMKLNVVSLRRCGALVHLYPLRDMPIEYLNLHECGNVRDLRPLKDMPLRWLSLSFTRISDIRHLIDLPLESITLRATKVTDLSPLKSSPLKYIDLCYCNASNFEVLKECPLQSIFLDVGDHINRFQNKSLENVRVRNGRNIDFANWQKCMSLKNIYIHSTEHFHPISKGLSRLKDYPLKSLALCGKYIVKDIQSIRGHKTLKHLDLSGSKYSDPLPLLECPNLITFKGLKYKTPLEMWLGKMTYAELRKEVNRYIQLAENHKGTWARQLAPMLKKSLKTADIRWVQEAIKNKKYQEAVKTADAMLAFVIDGKERKEFEQLKQEAMKKMKD